MRYGKATIEVVFLHDDHVPVEIAAQHMIQHGRINDVLGASLLSIEPLSEDEVIAAAGGCGDCDACRQSRARLALIDVDVNVDTVPSTDEDAAIVRAIERTRGA